MSFPRVLIVTPTYKGKDYCTRDFIHNVRKILTKTPGSRAIIVDNSNGSGYLDSLQKRYGACGVEFHHVPRGGNSRQAIANSMNYARNIFLTEGYDYMLVLEIDLFPKDTVIYDLMKYGKPVVGGTYMIGEEGNDDNERRPCIFVNEYKELLGIYGTRCIRMDEFKQEWKNTGIRQVHGMGLGCVLIQKSVIKEEGFWYNPDCMSKHHDVYFYLRLNNKGIPVFVDTSYPVPHYNSSWDDVKDR